MAKKSIAGSLLGMLGGDPSQQASTLLRMGTMGVVGEMTRAADRRVASRGGAPWTPSINRAKRQAAAAVRRQAPRGSVTRSAARAVAVSSRPNAVQRRAMRRESYRQQGEKLSDEQLVMIPANELPPELVGRRKEAMANRPRDEKGRFLSAGSPAAPAPSGENPATAPTVGVPPDAEQRKQLEQQLRAVVGDLDQLSPQARQQLERQIDQQVAGAASHPAEAHREPVESAGLDGPAAPVAPQQPRESPPERKVETPSQRKRESVQTVIDSQLEDVPQPRPEHPEKSGGWLDKVQMGLDAVGVADPTPITDGTNAAISLGRAAFDPERRREHLQNAGISAVSAAVPYVGDSAKLLKVGRAAKKAHAAEGAGRAATRGVAQGGAESAAMAGAQPVRRGIGGTVRRMAGGAVDGMIGDNRPRYGGGGGERPPGDHDQREGAPPIDPTEVQRRSSSGAPPVEPPSRFGAPSPSSDDGDSPRRQRDDAAGVAAHDKWTEKLKDGALSMASFAGKAYLAVEGLQLLNRGVLAINRDLAQYNGTLAGSYAKAENADIRRDMRRGATLSGPLSDLQEEQTELQDSLSELTTPIYGILVKGLAKLTEAANTGLSIAKALIPLELLNAFYDKYIADEDDTGEGTGGWEFLRDVSDGKFDGFDPEDFKKRFPHHPLLQDLKNNPFKMG